MATTHSASPTGAGEDGHGRIGALLPGAEEHLRRRGEVEARLNRNVHLHLLQDYSLKKHTSSRMPPNQSVISRVAATIKNAPFAI